MNELLKTDALRLTRAQIALMDALPAGVTPAQVRCALTAVIRRCFTAKGTFDADGWLTIGLCDHLLSAKDISPQAGFLPLGLPEDHPFWSMPDEPYTAQKVRTRFSRRLCRTLKRDWLQLSAHIKMRFRFYCTHSPSRTLQRACSLKHIPAQNFNAVQQHRAFSCPLGSPAQRKGRSIKNEWLSACNEVASF